jgi:hypothetical protein
LVNKGDIEFEFEVIEVIRGEEAETIVLAADELNNRAPEGTEYVLIKVAADYTGPDAGILTLAPRNISLISQQIIYNESDAPMAAFSPEPRFNFELLQGTADEGWFAWALPPDDKMLLRVRPSNTFFSLDEDGAVETESSATTDN